MARAALHAAAHPQRYALLRALAVRPRTASELSVRLELAPNLVSHHLRVLRQQRLVSVAQEGRARRYRIDDRAIGAAAHEFARSLAADAAPGRARPRVLFVCVHNAGWSQMARAFFERAVGDAARAESAGSEPAPAVHPNVRHAMSELGVRLHHRPKRVTATMVEDADVVVDMGCGDAIPAVPGVRRIAWSVPDPGGRSLEDTRRIRDDVASRTERLARTLLATR